MSPDSVITVAIVPAAGAGKRMGTSEPKQFLELDGEPVLLHTVRALQRTEAIDLVIVAAAASEVEKVREILAVCDRPVRVVPGGRTRFDSVGRGLTAAPESTELVVVHDGVRPFVTDREVEETIALAKKKGAAIVASSPVETVKERMEGHGLRTVDRDRLLLAQTPQAFRIDLIRRAYRQAEADHFVGTDEASLVERLNVGIEIVEASIWNRKMTTPDDLALASWIASRKEKS